jgi:predicted negative regulator of RcsB-dependent stress response
MKRKEKEHLKADPFVHFFEVTLAFFKKNRKPLLLSGGLILLVVIAILAVFLLQNLGSASENRLYAEAFRLRTSETMGADQKIAKLQEMKFKKGVSASGHLFLAALHYEKGDVAKAEAVLARMPKSRVAIVNDEKHMLYAQVLAAGGKPKEAEAVLDRMLTDKETVMGKDLVLLELAKLQVKGKRSAEAAATLKRIQSEHPNSHGAMEAQNLLATLEGKDSATQ